MNKSWNKHRGKTAYLNNLNRSRANQPFVCYTPVMWDRVWGFQTISSSLRWRSISFSYSTTVCLKTLNISSAAAVSRSLTNSLKHSTGDIVSNSISNGNNVVFQQVSRMQLTRRLFTSAGSPTVKFRQRRGGGDIRSAFNWGHFWVD